MLARHTSFALPLGLFTGLALSWMGGCVEPNPDHCVNNGGDNYCAEQHTDWDTAYCSDNTCVDEATPDGCQEELPLDCWYCDGKPQPECSDMATGDGDITGDGDGDTTGDGDGDGDTTGDGDGDAPCMGPEDCSSPDAPFCDADSGTCVNCEATVDPDVSCAGLDAAAPVCVMGACVECDEGKDDACMGTTPICDLGTNACVACSSHEECPETACNMSVGNCFDPANIVHVSGDDLDCPGGDGTEAAPFCTIADALISGPAEPFIVLHELFDNGEYQEDTVLTGTIAIFAAEGETPLLSSNNNNPAVTVANAGTLFMRGVEISGAATASGLSVAGGVAWLDECRVVNNAGGGIIVDNGGECHLTNSFVGGDESHQDAIYVINGTVEILYSTLFAGFGTSSALTCDDGSATTVRNSLMLSSSDDDELQCPSVTITSSALEMAVGDNTALGAFDPSWLVPGYAQGDFSLSGAHPEAIDTAAVWTTGDPTTDIHGDTRPDVDGTEDFAGADHI